MGSKPRHYPGPKNGEIKGMTRQTESCIIAVIWYELAALSSDCYSLRHRLLGNISHAEHL